MTNPPPMTDDLVGRLQKLLALATPRPWLIHSEPDVNYPATIHAVSTHRLGGVGDPIEPFGAWDQQLAVDAVNALPTLLARIEALEGENRKLREALAPFAKAGEIAGERSPYGDWYAYRPAAGDEYAIYGDHLRAARAALAKDKSDG